METQDLVVPEVDDKISNSFMSRLGFHKKNRSQTEERMIGDYILGQTLGMGGYSKVKLGIHKETKRKVALKIMFGDEKGDISESKKKQLRRELNVMQKVKHPNVIELIDVYDDVQYPEAKGDPKPCIVTVLEFAPGGELFDFLMFTGCFDEEATRFYLHQFMDGLEAIHKLGIAHRDLKPENLLMDSEYNLKIADFGFATEFKKDDGTEIPLRTSCGTKGYLAPELLLGKKYSHKCDLFAAGIITFTTFAGFPPFQNAVDNDWWWDKLSKAWLLFEEGSTSQEENVKEVKLKKSKEKFDLFWKAHERSRQFPDDIKDLVLRMLHPLPQKRLDIADVREHKWYKGKMYTSEEIKKYMNKRIRSVMKERALKVKKQLEEQEANTPSYKRRGDDTRTEYQKRIDELDPLHEFNDEVLSFKDDTFINTYHQFLTKAQPDEIAARIERVAVSKHAKTTFAPAQQITMIRCKINFRSDQSTQNDTKVEEDEEEDDVIMAVKQFLYDSSEDDKDSKDKKRYIVSFKRLQGTPNGYKKLVEIFYYSRQIMEVMDFDDVI